jgi:hypothetical protein
MIVVRRDEITYANEDTRHDDSSLTLREQLNLMSPCRLVMHKLKLQPLPQVLATRLPSSESSDLTLRRLECHRLDHTAALHHLLSWCANLGLA